MNKKHVLILSLLGALQACTQVDDYLLGKDNTPKPKNLKAMQSKVSLANDWVVPIGSSKSTSVAGKSSPVVIGKVLYTADASGSVKALNSTNKEVRWATTLPHTITSGPVVSEGKVVVATTAPSLVVLNQDSGKTLWEVPVSAEILANTLVTDNTVIAKTIDGNVYAFDSDTGKKLWFNKHGSPDLVLKASSSPVKIGPLVLIGFSDGKLDAYTLKTGNLAWQKNVSEPNGVSDVERLVDIDADPIIKGDIAYIASYQGELGAMSLKTGEFIWRKPASVYKNMALGKETLYLTDSHDVLMAFNSKNGNLIWKQDKLTARGLTEPVLMDKYVLVGDKTGLVHVLDANTGKMLARSQLQGAIEVAPVVTQGKVYIQTANGMLNQLTLG